MAVPPTTGNPASPGKDLKADLKAFAVIDTPRSAADALPEKVHHLFSSATGIYTGLVHKIETSDGVVWVFPGKDKMCIMSGPKGDRDAGAACTPNASAIAGYLEMEEVGLHTRGGASMTNFVSGLVPDGVKYVTLHLPGRRTISVRVHGNVYMRQVIGHIESVTFLGPHGPMTVGG
jgi:hypothetical protein